MHIHMEVCMCLCNHTCGGQRLALGVVYVCSLLFWETGSFTELGVHLLCRMTGQRALWILLGLHLWCWDYWTNHCVQLYYVDTELRILCLCGKGFTSEPSPLALHTVLQGTWMVRKVCSSFCLFLFLPLHHFLLEFETPGKQLTKMISLYVTRRTSVPCLSNCDWCFPYISEEVEGEEPSELRYTSLCFFLKQKQRHTERERQEKEVSSLWDPPLPQQWVVIGNGKEWVLFPRVRKEFIKRKV